MKTVSNISVNQILDATEGLGWRVDIEAQDEKWYAEFEKYSPAGEDFIFTVWFVDANELVEGVKEYAADFDQDEHIEMWIGARRNGVCGIPSTRKLVKDAEDIDQMLKELAEALFNAQLKYGGM